MTLGDSGGGFFKLGLIHCLLDGRGGLGCCSRGPKGIGGLSCGMTFEGPVGGWGVSGAMPEPWPAETGRSPKARGAVGGGLFDATLGRGCASPVLGIRFGTEPNAGADGATGGGEASLTCAADSWAARASILARKSSRSPRSLSSRGSRRTSASGYRSPRSRSSRSRAQRPS